MANELIELLRESADVPMIDSDGEEDRIRLKPPLTPATLSKFESEIPCPLPDRIRELLQFTNGFTGGPLESVDFAGEIGTCNAWELFPTAVTIGTDGYGNDWIVDLTENSTEWGPIFYVCHDAPVLILQSNTLLHFIREIVRMMQRPWKSEIDDVHEKFMHRIWNERPGMLSFDQSRYSGDTDLRDFASSLDENYEFIDLRNPLLGDGFAWGKYSDRRRFKDKRIFAGKKKLNRRLFDFIKRV